MDGSHLKTATGRLNTAGSPKALASVPVLASGEKRADHGERRWPGAGFPNRCRQLIFGGIFLGYGWVTGCGGSHPATSLPPALTYNGSQPFPAVTGEAILLTPAVTGSIDEYAVSPALPSGLRLNGNTGVISGTPTGASAAATFAVTATYRGGHSTFFLVLSVTEPPTHLSYPGPVTGTVGAALIPLSPKIAGTVEHYSVTPALPNGVVLDSRSGLIAGTPSVASTLAPYTITASSQAGNTSFIFLLAVAGPSARSNH